MFPLEIYSQEFWRIVFLTHSEEAVILFYIFLVWKFLTDRAETACRHERTGEHSWI